MWPARRQGDEPVLITEAPVSLDDQQAVRRRRYAVIMTLRVVCLLVAAAVFHYSIWLALALIGGGMILPWCAVIIANDRPAKKAERVAHFDGQIIAPTALESHPAADRTRERPSSGRPGEQWEPPAGSGH